MQLQIPASSNPRIVVIGAGFAGLDFIQHLIDSQYQIILLDRNNYHTFQPLLYQVATGGLEPDSIAYPIRRIFKQHKNFYFRMASVEAVEIEEQRVNTSIGYLSYDYLVLATGSKSNFFNLEGVKSQLMPMKTIPQALDLRSLLLQNFEKALLSENEEKKGAYTNVVVVGAGPTGVELAGALGEMKKYILPHDYKELNFEFMRIHLLEMMDRVLPPMSEKASRNSHRYLEKLGVNVMLKSKVEDYDGKNVIYNENKKLVAETFIWTAGVEGAAINGIPEQVIAKNKRVEVDEFNRVIGLENIFAIGDLAMMATSKYPKGHPMVAQVAKQQGKLLAKNFHNLLAQKPLRKFEYHDKGSLATIGRNKAVADLPAGSFKGFIAWIIWMMVHLLQLVGFRNKLVVFIGWVWNYFTYDRALRLIIRPYQKPITNHHASQ